MTRCNKNKSRRSKTKRAAAKTNRIRKQCSKFAALRLRKASQRLERLFGRRRMTRKIGFHRGSCAAKDEGAVASTKAIAP
jgi:hypothetical protein